MINVFNFLIAIDIFIVWPFLKGLIPKHELFKYATGNIKDIPQEIINGDLDKQRWELYETAMNSKFKNKDKNVHHNWVPYYYQFFGRKIEMANGSTQIDILPAKFGTFVEIMFWAKDVLGCGDDVILKLEKYAKQGVCCAAVIQGQIISHLSEFTYPQYVF